MSVMKALEQNSKNPTNLICDSTGKLVVTGVSGGGGGTGDASEATLLQIRDRLPAILSGGRLAVALDEPIDVNITSLTPVDVNVISSVLPTGAATQATLASLNASFGDVASTEALTNTANTGFISLFKRLLNTVLVKGQQLMAASLPVVIASDQSTLNVNVVSGGGGGGLGDVGEGIVGASTQRVVLASPSIVTDAIGLGSQTATNDLVSSWSIIQLLKGLFSQNRSSTCTVTQFALQGDTNQNDPVAANTNRKRCSFSNFSYGGGNPCNIAIGGVVLVTLLPGDYYEPPINYTGSFVIEVIKFDGLPATLSTEKCLIAFAEFT